MILIGISLWVLCGVIAFYISAPKQITLGHFLDTGYFYISFGLVALLLVLSFRYENKILWRKK